MSRCLGEAVVEEGVAWWGDGGKKGFGKRVCSV